MKWGKEYLFLQNNSGQMLLYIESQRKKSCYKKKTFKKTEEAATGGVLQEKLFLEITQNS